MQKNKMILWAVALLALVFLIFARPIRTGSVIGTIKPHNSATQAWIYSATDTLRSNIQEDVFQIAGAKAGIYTLVIEPSGNYKTLTRTGVKVADGEITNLGEITMENK
ncbi:carboxypeptidase regulatory-like domain-containing protein [Sediminibacterium roseum]|uniref:Carboxypeptidase regulatory-like domain-containing protein n=1 Tax=Sediminibacterium roseum TaxID=1978412 RepID=A0ABW9ZZ65_9BACT|nr:carboxypeptidase regulatory-like domain-containing protein [Sediminibacterium roseum]NCI50285.1 carboxypeptidase regulatory-like domain-containing protein [Sediminibacterium roseum]